MNTKKTTEAVAKKVVAKKTTEKKAVKKADVKKKKEAKQDGLQFIESVTQFMGKAPKYIRLDNSGENTKLQQVVK